MDKILIVGHRSSYYQELEKILQHCGMSHPLVSHSQSLSAKDITKKLLSATNKQISHKQSSETKYLTNDNEVEETDIQPMSSLSYSSEYPQRYPKKIWDNLAFDLILANVEQDFWGWSDTNAIHLLEYWAEFDEDIAFILTYDKPHQFLKSIIDNIDNIDELTERVITDQLQDWIQYNQALLSFQKKYPQRCLLVNGEQVITSAEQYINSVSQKITWNVTSPSAKLMDSIIEKQETSDSKELLYFINTILQQYSDILQVYSYLQKQADISLLENDNFDNLSSVMLALKSSLKNKKELKHTQYDLELAKNQVEQKVKDIQIIQNKLQENQYLQKLAQEELKQFSDENKSLVNQLHNIQEELENFHNKNQHDSKLLNELENKLQQKHKQLGNNQEKISALNIKVSERDEQISKLRQLQVQLEKEKFNHQQEKEMIVSQLHHVQEELENYALKNTEKQEQVSSLNKKIESSNNEIQKTQKIVATKECELQKKKEELNNSAKVTRYAEEQAEINKQKLRQLQSEREQLCSIKDVESNLKQENELLMKQLHQVQEELEKYYLESQQLNRSQSTAVAPIYYGAADRVKNDLPYRLGSTMVKNSKKPKDIVSLPLSLVKEYQNFQQEQKDMQLPPLERYQDLNEAEKVKQHLSYRLGKVIVDSMKSPTKLALAPVAMIKEFRGFQKSK